MTGNLALGLDFGTESVRAVLVDVADGRWVAGAVRNYLHGVMERELCDGGPRLPADFALQHPDDYFECMQEVVREVMAAAAPDRVVGIGVDFTACTMLPVDAQWQPLCRRPEFAREPHAYVKLWKHHGANAQAARINACARERQESWLTRYGGTTSSEWLLAKAWETLQQAPRVFAAAEQFLEASDLVVARLTGNLVRGACAAGYKGLWSRRDGYPSDEFLSALDPALKGFYQSKVKGPVAASGTRAGYVCEEWLQRLGLRGRIAVSPAIIDAHAAVPGCGVTREGQMVIILGTSSCHMLLGKQEVRVPGIQGVVEDGILPGFFGYEAGQAATGDLLDWFVDGVLGAQESEKAACHERLTREAQQIGAGATGLLVLDWWNGNRSVLINPELSGVIVGLTRTTTPAEIYRALIEGTAFGTLKILDNFDKHGVPVEEIFVCGGMAENNPLLLQIYASVTGRSLRRAASSQVCALGAAIFAALAAGRAGGGHDRIEDAVQAMVGGTGGNAKVVHPDTGSMKLYRALFEHWNRLHDHFGRGGHHLMPLLRKLRG